MSATRRTMVRKSMLALLVSFLREGTTDTTKFSMVPSATGKYPFDRNVWGFTLGTEYFQITLMEASDEPLPFGVTLQFGIEQPDESRAMPQLMNLKLGVTIKTPLSLFPTQESLALQISQKIDQALFTANGFVIITDYDVEPAVMTTNNNKANWTRVRRGAWEFQKANVPFEELRMEMTIQYSQPQEEW